MSFPYGHEILEIYSYMFTNDNICLFNLKINYTSVLMPNPAALIEHYFFHSKLQSKVVVIGSFRTRPHLHTSFTPLSRA